MARKCVCQICKTQLTTDSAFKISKGSRNLYYCSEQEYSTAKQYAEDRDNCYYTAARIMEVPLITPAMRKEINELAKYYKFIVIERTFKECKDSIRRFLSNHNNSSDFGKARYIMTIVKGNINSIHNKYNQEQKEIKSLFDKTKSSKNIDVEIMNNMINQAVPISTVKTKPRVSDISAWL